MNGAFWIDSRNAEPAVVQVGSATYNMVQRVGLMIHVMLGALPRSTSFSPWTRESVS